MDSDSDETLSDENDSSISSDELERSDSEDDDSLVEEFSQSSMDDCGWKVNNSSFSASFNYYDGHALRNNVIQPIDSFFTFISQDLIKLITDQTNIYGKQRCVEKGEDAKNWKEINENQTHAFLGLLFIMGFHKLPRIRDYCINIPANATWTQNGVTIAGGHGQGGATNQLHWPRGLFVDDDQTVVIADHANHRIMQWKNGDTTNGQVAAGGKGSGNGLHQLNQPTDVLIDKETDSIIICDQGNRRVVRWSRRSGTTQGEILIDTIDCWGLAMDEHRYIYVSDRGKHEVRRYQLGEKNGTLVAGGNGQGNGLNQLNVPTSLFVDRQQTVYVSDHSKHRVMKWNKGAKEGIVVAGGQGQGNALTQLSLPNGIFVDTLGTLYVADSENHRVMRWTQADKKQGTIIVGGNGEGEGANQFNCPVSLSFDRHGNLYVADRNNNRVQRFSIE
ncbi:unnamed protein product [Rotaria socialis]|uniref:PiggyBac transposable element-derived protein domain-containing protein n=1 Tax=Rotaria socialis TaxID=392032 RepID=A0A818MND1_9BILA|nr:unnamed protein product [Rotaria socialis]